MEETKNSDYNIQTENLNALGFITPILKRNFIIGSIIVLLWFIYHTLGLVEDEKTNAAKDRKNCDEEKTLIVKEFLNFTKEQIYQRDSLLERQRQLENKQRQVYNKLNKLENE